MTLTPSFLVGGVAGEMAQYYADVFHDGEVENVFSVPGADGQDEVVTATVRLQGTRVLIINGPKHTPNESSSFIINCNDQAEVDHFWNRFVGDGGEEGNCGWCKDKFGFSWQVVPEEMPVLFNDPDHEKGTRAFQSMMTMNKIELAEIKAAMETQEAH